MDIYKCPKSKTKSRIYFFIVTRKNPRKTEYNFVMIYGATTEIVIYTMFLKQYENRLKIYFHI
jgi:hypothetical protein